MPFLELALTVRAEDEARAEHALMDIGALSVTLLDADASTPNERAVLEPGVGEQPLWPQITLLALPITAAVLRDEGEHLGYGERWLRPRLEAVQGPLERCCRQAVPAWGMRMAPLTDRGQFDYSITLSPKLVNIQSFLRIGFSPKNFCQIWHYEGTFKTKDNDVF